MPNATSPYTVRFPDGYDAYVEHEHYSKGYLADVTVCLADGRSFELFFVDAVRLRQDLEERGRRGNAYFAVPNMVVLEQVTAAEVSRAVDGLVKEGFFDELGPTLD